MNRREDLLKFENVFFSYTYFTTNSQFNLTIILSLSSSSYSAVSGMREQRNYRYTVASSLKNISGEVGKINGGYCPSDDNYNRDNNNDNNNNDDDDDDDDNANGEGDGELFGHVVVENT